MLKLVKADELPQNVYQVIRPTGSQRPRMCGLPKVHKQNASCCPTLSMIGSAQHDLAKFLAALLQPVLNRYSINCIQDSFTFAERIQKLSVSPNKCFLCSYDICSLFTNVPLAETIEICSQALYNGDLPEPIIPKHVFTDLMKIVTSSVEFSFNNCMYRKIDGVAMGSPLGPALANMFVEFYEPKLSTKFPNLKSITITSMTHLLSSNEVDSKTFLTNLNSLHTSLKFTSEKEVNQSQPFLDVLFTKSTNNFTTSVYRKATFTGEYIRWNLFGPKTHKTNLIATLTHCSFKICSKSSLQQELDAIKSLFLKNGYPESVINARISKKILQF